jgi:hypothetical protein
MALMSILMGGASSSQPPPVLASTDHRGAFPRATISFLRLPCSVFQRFGRLFFGPLL